MTTQNQPLQAGELTEWIALRRVCAGGVALLGSRYLDLGRPVPGYLDGPLAELHGAGLVALADVDRWLLRRVVPTRTGRARYGELSAKRCTPDDPRPAASSPRSSRVSASTGRCPTIIALIGGRSRPGRCDERVRCSLRVRLEPGASADR